MPDSKLAEKLGFTIEPVSGRLTIVRNTPNSKYVASREEIALWNLCLELSERLADIKAAYAVQEKCSHYVGDPVICDACLYERQKKMAELLKPERLAEKEKKA